MKHYNVTTKDGYVISGIKAPSLAVAIRGLAKMIGNVINEDRINELDEIRIKEVRGEAFEFGREMTIQNEGLIGEYLDD